MVLNCCGLDAAYNMWKEHLVVGMEKIKFTFRRDLLGFVSRLPLCDDAVSAYFDGKIPSCYTLLETPLDPVSSPSARKSWIAAVFDPDFTGSMFLAQT